MQPPKEKDESVKRAEQMTVEWIHAFLDEVYRIDDFFKERQDSLINEFISLQDKLRLRTIKDQIAKKKGQLSEEYKYSSIRLGLNHADSCNSSIAEQTGMSGPRPGLSMKQRNERSQSDDNVNVNGSESFE